MPVATIKAVATAPPYTVTLTDDFGHQRLADEPPKAAAPTPGLLGAYTAITLQLFAASRRWPLTGVEVELQFNPDGKPTAGGTDVRRRITLQGALSAEQRERLLQAANAYPMHKALTGEVRVPTTLRD